MWTLKFTPEDEAYLEAKGAEILTERESPESLFIWSAFHALRGSRAMGLSPGPIPLSEVASYCDLMQIEDVAQRQRLMAFIAALDRAEREYYGKHPA